jgi:hypothetical protein
MAWGFVAGAAISVVGGVLASGNAEDAANNATAAQASSAATEAQLGQDQLAFAKQQYSDEKPIRDQVSTAELGLLGSQKAASDQQTAIAGDYDAYNKGTFRPLEKSLVSDAEGYDTAGRRADAAAAARSDVEQSFGGAEDALQRNLRRSGVTVGSGRNAALMSDEAYSKAAAEAGATTGAVRSVEQQGYARRMDAASLGRGLPSAQATAQSVGTQAANSAVGAGNSAVAASQAGVPTVMQGYSGAIGATQGAGSLYGQAANTYNSVANADSAGLQMFGNAAGKWAGSTAGSQTISGWLSDESKKKGTGKKLSGKKALKAIEKTPVDEGWSYDPAKGGPDEGGVTHDGPMAADVAANMPSASDGHTIDPITMNGHLMAGMAELSKRVKNLEGKRARRDEEQRMTGFRGMLGLLGGLGQGYVEGKQQQTENDRQAALLALAQARDAREQQAFDRQRQEQQAVQAAGQAPAPQVDQQGGTMPATMDNADIGQPGEPTIQPTTYAAGGQTGMSASQAVDASRAADTPDAQARARLRCSPSTTRRAPRSSASRRSP